DLRHANVADQNIQEQSVLSRIDRLDRLFSVLSFKDVIAGLLQRHANYLADVRLVVDDQYAPICGLIAHEKSRCKFSHDVLLIDGKRCGCSGIAYLSAKRASDVPPWAPGVLPVLSCSWGAIRLSLAPVGRLESTTKAQMHHQCEGRAASRSTSPD